MNDVLEALTTVLVAIATVATPILLRELFLWLRTKRHLAITQAEEEELTELTRQGVAWAEERAREAIKGRRSAEVPPETTHVGRLSAAVQYVKDARKARGKNALADEQVERRVKAELQRERARGMHVVR